MIRAAITAVVLSAALAAGGSTAQTASELRDQAKLAKTLEGLTPGKETSCINRHMVSHIRTFEDTIVYVQGRNKKWRNDTVGGCSGLKHDDIIVTRSPMSSQYCSGDIIETRSRSGGFVTGACSLGKFVPYTK
jgi:hypothetical protein